MNRSSLDEGGRVEPYKPLTPNVSKDDKKSGEKTKKGYTESQWFKAAFLSEKSGKFGAREQIRAQVQGDNVTIQVVRQGAVRRVFQSLNPFGSKEKVVAHVQLKKEDAGHLLVQGSGQSDEKVNVENAKIHIRACQMKQALVSKDLNELIKRFEGYSNKNLSDLDKKQYAELKSQLNNIKVALSKVDAFDKISDFDRQIKELKPKVDGFQKLSSQPPALKKKQVASPIEQRKKTTTSKKSIEHDPAKTIASYIEKATKLIDDCEKETTTLYEKLPKAIKSSNEFSLDDLKKKLKKDRKAVEEWLPQPQEKLTKKEVLKVKSDADNLGARFADRFKIKAAIQAHENLEIQRTRVTDLIGALKKDGKESEAKNLASALEKAENQLNKVQENFNKGYVTRSLADYGRDIDKISKELEELK